MKIVPTFVGLDPGPRKYKNKGSTIKKLDSWTEAIGLPYYGFFNVCPEPDMVVDWEFVWHICSQSPINIALGVKAGMVLDKLKIEHLKMPHPSGLNRKLNSPVYLADQLGRLKQYISARRALFGWELA